jgi:hypothetical protein
MYRIQSVDACMNCRIEENRLIEGFAKPSNHQKRVLKMSKLFSLIIVFMGFMASEVFSQASYEFVLAGYNQVPSVRTAATGTMEIIVEGDSLFVTGSFQDLRGHYWSAFIHYGKEGETGNRLIRLRADLNEEKNGGVFLKEKNRFELRPAIKDALRNGNLYMVISSNRNQDGEIRGQLPRM